MMIRPLTPLQRASAYILFVAVGTLLAFWTGMKVEEQRACGAADFDGECDLVGLAGMVWAAVSIPAALVLIGVVEMWLRSSHRDTGSR